MGYKYNLEELEEFARVATREALKGYVFPEEYNDELTLSTLFDGDYLVFVLYIPGERPEDALILTRAWANRDTGQIERTVVVNLEKSAGSSAPEYAFTRNELVDLARSAMDKALNEYIVPDEYKDVVKYRDFAFGETLIFEFYLPGKQPEDDRILAIVWMSREYGEVQEVLVNNLKKRLPQ